MSKQGCAASRGTYSLQLQPGGSYPFTFYGDPIPLDDKLFNEFLDKHGLMATEPVGSGYAVSSHCYSPVGGVTDLQIQKKCCFKNPYDPVLPPYQNQYTTHSHFQDIYKECCPQPQVGSLEEAQETECPMAPEGAKICFPEAPEVPLALGEMEEVEEGEAPQISCPEEIEKAKKNKALLAAVLLLGGYLFLRR